MRTTRWAVLLALGLAACGTQDPAVVPDQTPTGAIDQVVEQPVQPGEPREANVLPETPASGTLEDASPSPSPTATAASPTPSATATPRRSGGGGGSNATPTPSPTPTRSPSPSPSPSASASTSPSPSPSASRSPSPSPTPSRSPSPSPTPTPTPSATPTPDVVSFSSDVVPILRQHCASCHTAGGMGAGAVTMFNATGQAQYTAIKAEISAMIQAIEEDRMPLGNPGSVSDAKVDTLDGWRDAGAPNN